ncbi:10665_t:CDS:2 [Ambispora gerdemannii]|uniref:Ubiquitin-like 1-activating enzyme E1A n=1 Tax=Ambispora gerdemannii TaxID=144530 RepID=A0A9N8V4U2_9GLOM|nr:10665_t:CDS:2 [Ambispora gerdemannii]
MSSSNVNAENSSVQNAVITEDEAAIYDRQIRLWGLEAQQRMLNSKILMVGMRGLSNEVCKNLVLAGIGSLTILDDQKVTQEDLGAQFFLSADDIGKNRAVASRDRVRNLNPRVVVTADSDKLAKKPEEFFNQFDVICLTDCDLDTLIHVNEICRKFDKKFYAASAMGLFGYIFCDLNYHAYVIETKEDKSDKEEPDVKRIKRETQYVSLETSLSKNDWAQIKFKKLKKISEVLWAIPIIWKFKQNECRPPNPDDTSNDENSDFMKLRSISNEYLKSINVEPSLFTNVFLKQLLQNVSAEISPVCAIVGGILAQDILKVLSQKGPPINNFFVFNGLDCSGIVYQVEPGKKAIS